MAKNFKEKITMRFNVSQLDRATVALLNNGYNKKFAAKVASENEEKENSINIAPIFMYKRCNIRFILKH